MPEYMTVPVDVQLTVELSYPNLVDFKVSYKDIFEHRFRVGAVLLSRGLQERASGAEATLEPVGDRISITANVWHWSIPVEIERSFLHSFLRGTDILLDGLTQDVERKYKESCKNANSKNERTPGSRNTL